MSTSDGFCEDLTVTQMVSGFGVTVRFLLAKSQRMEESLAPFQINTQINIFKKIKCELSLIV